MTSEHPISDAVFKYQFECNQVSKTIDLTTRTGIEEKLDKTTETYQGCVEYHKHLNKEERIIFSTLQGFGIAFDWIPHDLDICSLYPMLCDVEKVMRMTFGLIAENEKEEATA